MSIEEFYSYLNEVVIPAVQAFSHEVEGRHEIIVCGRLEHIDDTGDFKLIEIEPKDLDGLKVYFAATGSTRVFSNQSHLTFGLNASGHFKIYSQLQIGTKPDEIGDYQNLDGLGQSHIFGFLKNQYDKQIT